MLFPQKKHTFTHISTNKYLKALSTSTSIITNSSGRLSFEKDYDTCRL